ncbi:ImmA/IrrE family metallo-endopeptidase [Selenomonas bovis]|uniref:ImmA/IrrE family metallo-endopeptidase n=1 Tax=Selenomonas bovis TaxID=416586 RepID=UPI00035DC07D
MNMNIMKFNGQRLRDALQFRGKKMAELSRETGISRQSLSLYANEENVPPYENVQRIAKNLDFPSEYFLSEDKCTTVTTNTYFRSQAAAKKKEQNAQEKKLEYTAKMYEILLNYVDFPALHLTLPMGIYADADDVVNAEPEEMQEKIEKLTLSLRKAWGIGNAPIENMQFLLESNGIVMTGFRNVDDKIDAFSQKVHVKNGDSVYIVALALGKKPRERLRFDMAHELGHIMMHNWDESNEDLNREEFNAIERQANMFASAFLLPRESFGKMVSPYATNIEFYRSLKKKWGVSMQAMMYRARQLDIISVNQFQYMMRQISQKGWRTHEPGDVPGNLNSTIFQGAIDVLFDGGYLNARELVRAFRDAGIWLNTRDMEDLMGLKPGTLDAGPKILSIKPRIEPK